MILWEIKLGKTLWRNNQVFLMQCLTKTCNSNRIRSRWRICSKWRQCRIRCSKWMDKAAETKCKCNRCRCKCRTWCKWCRTWWAISKRSNLEQQLKVKCQEWTQGITWDSHSSSNRCLWIRMPDLPRCNLSRRICHLNNLKIAWAICLMLKRNQLSSLLLSNLLQTTHLAVDLEEAQAKLQLATTIIHLID